MDGILNLFRKEGENFLKTVKQISKSIRKDNERMQKKVIWIKQLDVYLEVLAESAGDKWGQLKPRSTPGMTL